MARTTNLQVKMMMAEAQLAAACVAMVEAHRDYSAGLMTNAERGRVLAKRTRLETKVFLARAELQGRVYDMGDA